MEQAHGRDPITGEPVTVTAGTRQQAEHLLQQHVRGRLGTLDIPSAVLIHAIVTDAAERVIRAIR